MLKYGGKYFIKNGKKCLQCVQEYYIINIVKDDEHLRRNQNVDKRIFKKDQPDNESYTL